MADAELLLLRAEVARLKAALIIPGVMHCAKCKFQLTKKVLCMSLGAVGAGDSNTEPCPNGCGPLWPVTWQQADQENQEIIGRLCDEKGELQERVRALQVDAGRYRHLRALHWYESPLAVVRNPAQQVKPGSDCPSGSRLDAVIDEVASCGGSACCFLCADEGREVPHG